mmetsp:Transcript_29096/g.55994  ORF Transcript_29096/g.55994 Transcript_29096/m.55994 type:complete len:211 (+) Transcript_29096:4123-4755(+)
MTRSYRVSPKLLDIADRNVPLPNPRCAATVNSRRRLGSRVGGRLWLSASMNVSKARTRVLVPSRHLSTPSTFSKGSAAATSPSMSSVLVMMLSTRWRMNRAVPNRSPRPSRGSRGRCWNRAMRCGGLCCQFSHHDRHSFSRPINCAFSAPVKNAPNRPSKVVRKAAISCLAASGGMPSECRRRKIRSAWLSSPVAKPTYSSPSTATRGSW